MHRLSSQVSRFRMVIGATSLVVPLGSSAFAAINGFGSGSGYTLNGRQQDDFGNVTSTTSPPSISGGVLTLSDANSLSVARSAFFNTKQNVTSFTASFVYRNTNPANGLGLADGFAFVVQNQGLTALGGNAAGLGVTTNDSAQPPTGTISPIVPAAYEEFYARNGTGATEVGTNGSGTFTAAVSSAPVDLTNGDPIQITLTYSGATKLLTETLTDQTTLATYTSSSSVDIPTVVGSMAYVGFTGATGGATSLMTISNFTFTPEPASLAAGAAVLLLAGRRPGRR